VQVLKGKNYQLRSPYSAKNILQECGEIQRFSDEGKPREFTANRSAPKQMLKEVSSSERKNMTPE